MRFFVDFFPLLANLVLNASIALLLNSDFCQRLV